MLSQAAQSAFQAVAWLATHTSTPQTARQIAEGTHVRPGYLSKVLQTLARAGLVTSHRGPHGGFVLNRSPDCITLLDIIRIVHPHRRASAGSDAQARPPWSERLDDVFGAVERMWGNLTIAQILNGRGRTDIDAPEAPRREDTAQ